MEQPETEIFTCEECDSHVKGYHRFCYNCGAWLGSDASQISIFNNRNLQSAFFFYIIYLFICLVVRYTEWFESYDHLFFIEIVLAVVTIIYARANWQNIKPLFRFNNFKFTVLIVVIFIAVFFSLGVSISVKQLNISLFNSDASLYRMYSIYQWPVLLMIYSVAVMPAIFEELAFRGIIFNYLENFLDDKMVVMVTGCTFAALHLSLISLIWLIPFGIFLGNLRRKYHTLWYGIVFHFTFNCTACVYDLYQQGELWWLFK